MENIAIVYRGFYFRNKNKKKTNSFDESILQNHIQYIYSNFKNITVFFHTYSVSDEKDAQLLELFKKYNINIKSYIFEKDINPKIYHSIIESQKVIQNFDCFDNIINLRFDLMFKKSIINTDIDLNKFNFIFRGHIPGWKKNNKVSDLLYIFPPKFNQHFITAIYSTRNITAHGDAHFIYRPLTKLINLNNINFLLEDNYSSDTDACDNPLVKICR